MTRWKLLWATLAALVLSATSTTTHSRPEAQEFDGWVVLQDGVERRYPQSQRWTGKPEIRTFTLRRNSEYVIFYGTFRVWESRPAKPPVPLQRIPPQTWTVTQEGQTETFRRQDHWEISLSPNGFEFQRKGEKVWYYGGARLEHDERPR